MSSNNNSKKSSQEYLLIFLHLPSLPYRSYATIDSIILVRKKRMKEISALNGL